MLCCCYTVICLFCNPQLICIYGKSNKISHSSLHFSNNKLFQQRIYFHSRVYYLTYSVFGIAICRSIKGSIQAIVKNIISILWSRNSFIFKMVASKWHPNEIPNILLSTTAASPALFKGSNPQKKSWGRGHRKLQWEGMENSHYKMFWAILVAMDIIYLF